jgi:SAM-dependent methyltransferase
MTITDFSSISFEKNIPPTSAGSYEFFLDQSSEIDITGTPVGLTFPRWMQVSYCVDKRTSLILISGESIRLTSPMGFEDDTRLFIRYCAALPSISADGLVCEVYFAESGKEISLNLICSLSVPGGGQTSAWRMIELDISFLSRRVGHFVLRCQPGPDGDSSGDWLAIADLSIARMDRLPILKARSFHAMRAQNEIDHFSSVYRHSMYASEQDQRADLVAGTVKTVRKLVQFDNADEIKISPACLENTAALPGEAPYSYALRLLAENIPQTPPNFATRLISRSEKGGVVKVLSLCSGAARIEASFAAQVGSNVEWSLLDINVDLLGLASKQFPPSVKLDLIEANVNALKFSGEQWDVILCVSALHHLVELENVVKFCHDSLSDGGEFWSIGEYVGRNGNRLWPDARLKANTLFEQLPEQFRFNHHTRQLDCEVPDNDYSVGCFEGIRSEDIEPVLDRWFHPEDVYRRNCFLWRLVNLAYSDNYDLRKPDVCKTIAMMVNAEVEHFAAGGRGTELHGIYRPRLFRKHW